MCNLERLKNIAIIVIMLSFWRLQMFRKRDKNEANPGLNAQAALL